jgi:hypothetical protein
MFDSSLIFFFEYFSEIDSIEVIVWIADVSLFVTDDSSKLTFLINDSIISILNDKINETFFVSIFLSVVLLDSDVNVEVNISNLLNEKSDLKYFIIFEFLNFLSSKDYFVSIFFVLISNWNLFFLSFFLSYCSIY